MHINAMLPPNSDGLREPAFAPCWRAIHVIYRLKIDSFDGIRKGSANVSGRRMPPTSAGVEGSPLFSEVVGCSILDHHRDCTVEELGFFL
jgi:hypothetical protein